MSIDVHNELEQALVDAVKDPALRPRFYQCLVQSDIYFIQHGQPVAGKDGPVTLTGGAQLQIATVTHNGQDYVPIFSSLPRLQKMINGEVSYLRLNALEFLKVAQGSSFVLNPGSDYGKTITAAEAASIADGSIWTPRDSYTVKEDTQVLLGQPSNYPVELVDALKRFFKTKREVKRAWLAHLFDPSKDESPHTLIAVEVSQGFESIVAEASMVLNSVNIPDPPVDLIQINGTHGLESYFTQETKPFYTRRLFGFL